MTLQQRKKDYLMRLLEELMKTMQKLIDKRDDLSIPEKESILNDAFEFYHVNLDVTDSDTYTQVVEKIADTDLLDHYINLLYMKSDISGSTDKVQLTKALAIIEYLEQTNTTYSWERTVLKEDILHKLDENEHTEELILT